MTAPGEGIELGIAYLSIAGEATRLMRDTRDAIRDAQRYVDTQRLNLRAYVDLDGDRAVARMGALRRELESMARPIRQEINVDVDRNGASTAVRAVTSELGTLSKAAGGTAAVAAGIAAIGGAAGAALGAVGALAVGLAALGPAAAAAGATIAVGLQGIADSFKALGAAGESAGADAKAQAKAVAAAQEQVIAAHERVQAALENVEDAQQNLNDAQKDARDAARDVGQAYKDAAEDLEDYQFKLRGSAIDQKEAALALREAQNDVFEAGADPAKREKALVRLERAQLNYDKSVESGKDLQEEAAIAQAKGVEGSDKVIAAKDRAADADRRVIDAEKGVEKAHQQVEKAQQQVEKAQQALADASSQSSAAQDKAAAALAKLSPNAREFVLAAQAAKPAWDDLTHAVQDKLFDGAADGIADLVTNSLPTLKAGMVDVAGSLNGLTQQFVAFWQAPENLAAIQSIFAGTKGFIDGLGPGLQQATQGFLSFGQAFEPVANQVGAQFAGMLGRIGQAFTDTFQNGQLTQLFSTFGDILQGLGAGLNPLIQGLIEMGNIVGPTLGPFFEQFGKSIQALAPSMGALGATFVNTLTSILPDLDKFIAALATGLEPVLPVIGDLLRSVMTALTPMVGPLSELTQIVGTALTQAVTALAPAIGPLSEAFVSLIGAIAPMLPVVAEVVAGIVSALAPALKTIFDALGPVIKQWTDAMLPVFRELQPVLADVAQTIGTAIAGALEQIAPYIPDIARSFSELVLALTPLLPQFAQLAADLLPPLMDVVIAILPQITGLIDAFTWLANNVIVPVLIPAIKGLSEYLGDQLHAAATAVTTARDIIGGALDTLGGFFSGLASTVSRVWDTIVGTIKGSVAAIGRFLVGLPEIDIPDIPGVPGRGSKIGFRAVGESMVTWGTSLAGGGIAGRSADGRLWGPGTGTSDSIFGIDLRGVPTARVSAGEGVVRKSAMDRGGNELVAALNAGWVPSPEFLRAMLPGFADGGVVPGKRFAQSMDPVPYQMGGFSRRSIDCSGMVAAVVNDALGLDPFSGRMSTVNEGQWLAAKGAQPGLGGPGDISIGWFDRGGGANGHTAMTLGDGTNVESRGGDGVVVGANAAGAADKMFDKRMHIPAALLRGGDLGGPASNGRGLGASGGLSGGLSGGTSTGAGAPTSGAATGTNQSGLAGNATPVFVTNWPASGSGVGGPAAAAPALTTTPAFDGPSATSTPPSTPEEALRQAGVRNPTPSAPAPPAPGITTTTPQGQGSHPLAGLPLPGQLGQLFQGPAPWFLAATPEQAVMNLGTQAAGLAQKTGQGFVDLFKNNWKEMLNTGLAVAGMGVAGGGGGPTMQVNNYGMDPNSAAAAVERQWRRRTLANQRSGGFGR